jgi:hypothetical protein
VEALEAVVLMGIVRKLRDGARWIENVVEQEAPRPKPAPEPKPEPAPKPKADLTLFAMFAAWCADIDSVPFPRFSAPEATR